MIHKQYCSFPSSLFNTFGGLTDIFTRGNGKGEGGSNVEERTEEVVLKRVIFHAYGIPWRI